MSLILILKGFIRQYAIWTASGLISADEAYDLGCIFH